MGNQERHEVIVFTDDAEKLPEQVDRLGHSTGPQAKPGKRIAELGRKLLHSREHAMTEGQQLIIFEAETGRVEVRLEGETVINDVGLAALALLIAESDPTAKDVAKS